MRIEAIRELWLAPASMRKNHLIISLPSRDKNLRFSTNLCRHEAAEWMIAINRETAALGYIARFADTIASLSTQKSGGTLSLPEREEVPARR